MVHRVAVLPTPGSTLFETGIAGGGVLGVDWDGERLYDVLIRAGAERLALDGGVTLTVAGSLADAVDADTLIVPGTSHRVGPFDPALLTTLRDAHEAGRRIVSICTGAFVLGAAGLLDGRSATTHWRHCAELRGTYPRTLVLPDRLYVDDDRVITGAGCSAGIDVCLHLVKTDHGMTIANRLARDLVVSSHRPGDQAQFAGPEPLSPEANWLGDLEAWVVDQEDVLTVEDLAAAAHVSRRTLTRRFDRELGTSPARWLNAVRIRRARELLETTTLPVDVVSAASGFTSPATFRAAFHRVVGVSPGLYRRTWAA